MASSGGPLAGSSQANAGPSHDTGPDDTLTNSHAPTSSNSLVNTQKHKRLVQNVASAVVDMVERACALHDQGAEVLNLRHLADSSPFAVRVATMCSGTEAPIFFLRMLMETFVTTGKKNELFRFQHVFSVEKEPFKQAYILRNTDAIVFRDVLDFAGVENHARTAKGSLAPIPGNIDILIAGTTCVDFSSLNSRKQTSFSKTIVDIAEDFEGNPPDTAEERLRMMFKVLDEIKINLHRLASSEQTFFSMLVYVRNHRPRIVILENVRGAPFDVAKNLWFNGLNYASATVVLDTKKCYFPQTRERNYLLAVDREEFQEADEAISRFSDIIEKLKRPKPESVEDFLLADNDTRAQLARLEAEDTARNKKTRETDWDYSNLIHDEQRRDIENQSRPLTGWKEDGTNNFYDRMDKIIMKTQPPRVLDSLDISHLKSQREKSPYDIRYKTKVLDLSQNVDRHHFNTDFGTVPCITPKGMPWITNQWRFVTGLEALILQGLPIERINFSHENQANLLDLAGNAMTTTAVGMVFTAALLCLGGRKVDSGATLLQSFHGNLDYQDLERPFASTVEQLIPVPYPCIRDSAYSTTKWPDNMRDLMAFYVRARRYCCCSGSTKYSVKKTRRCRACSVVRCTNCAGNPAHRFEPAKDFKFQPVTFQNAERGLTRLLPTVILSLFSSSEAKDQLLRQSPLGVIVDKLWTAEFFYQRTYVTEAVTVQYASNAGFILHAVIQDEGITWYLFLDRYSDLGNRSIKPNTWLEAHCMRKKPLARCIVGKEKKTSRPALLEWEFWIFPQPRDKKAKFQVLKQSIGGRNRITLQYTHDPSLEYAVNNALQRLSGDYDHHPECESAEDSLHIRKSTNGCPRLYLFKDATRSGELNGDIFVISHENRLLQPHEHREALVEFAPSVQLHKIGFGISPPAEVDLRGCWKPMRDWTRLSQRKTVLGKELLFPSSRYPKSLLSCLTDNRLLFELKVACPRYADAQNPPIDPQFLLRKLEWVSQQSQGRWAVVPIHQIRNFFDTFSFATSKAIMFIENTEFVDIPSCGREGCSVRLPKVKWYIPEPKALPAPLHLTEDIDRYEAALKEQAPVFQAQFQGFNATHEQLEVRLRFIANHARLAHRAEATMPPERKAILTEPSDITLSARTQTRRNAPLIFPLDPFQESIRPLKVLSGVTLPYAPFSKTQQQLKPEQMLSLQWLLELERRPKPFTERESEEEIIDGLQLRLVGTAERRVTRRGGLVADDIGYGKTVLMCAVTDLQRGDDVDRFKERRNREKHDRRKALECSLVIAPSHIVEQWGNEARKFLGYDLNKDVILVQKLSDLRGKQIAKLLRARLIIVSDAIFTTQSYQEPLSFWSGCPFPGASMTPAKYAKWLANRSYTAWHDDCMACMGDFLGDFLADESTNSRTRCLKKINRRHHDRESENKALKRHAESKEAETDGEDDSDEGTSQKKPRDKEKMFYEELFNFEFFSFNRVIWDEVGYNNPTVSQFVASVSAVSKWLLSGTPASQNLADICSYANALGIHLARPIDLREGLPSAALGPSLGTKTPCETIASYGRSKSDEFVKERHSQGQLFLKKFSSANMVDRGRFKTEYKVVISSPTLADRAVYQSLQHDISRAEMNADFLSGDGLQQVYAAVGETVGKPSGRQLAVESLIHAASVPSFAKKSWLLFSNQLDEEDGGKTKKRSFAQAVRMIQAKRLFDAKIYVERLFEKLIWLTYRFFVSSHIKGKGQEKDEYSAKAHEKTKGFIRTIKFLKRGDLEEFGGEDNYVLLVHALFPDLPYTAHEILSQAKSKDGLRLEPLNNRKIVDFASPPGLENPDFDFLYATRKTSWCHFYEADIGKIDKLPIEDLAGLALDYERELRLLQQRSPQQGSSTQGFEKMDTTDTLAHLEDIQTDHELADEEELRDMVRKIATDLHNKKQQERIARKNAYVADESHPKLDSKNKATTKDRLALELRKNGVRYSSSASRPKLIERLTQHAEGSLSVKDYKSPNHDSLLATSRMPGLTETMEIRGSKVLETQDEFLTHYNLFIGGLKHLFERSSQLRRAQFFDRLSRAEGYKFTCYECGSTNSLHLVHDCGHILCSQHVQNKKWCGEGSTLCTSTLGNFVVPIEYLAVSSRGDGPSNGPEKLSGGIKLSGTEEANDAEMPDADEANDAKIPDGDADADTAQTNHKIRTVIELIQKKIPQDDKVVVFTQYKVILNIMVEQLTAHGITCNTTTGSRKASEVLESFKKGEFKVLVMKQNSSEAAGGNLVVANHVIFVSPLVESSQHQYDAHMRQATGRCIREGQKKPVYVYHCATEGTIEANILELRQGKKIMVERGEMLGELVPSPDVGVPGGLRSTLSRAEVWRAMDEQDYNTTIGMKDGQVEFST